MFLTASAEGSFPGGRARLPRLNQAPPPSGPRVTLVDTAFVGGGTCQEQPASTGFEGYFTADSLFDSSDEVIMSPECRACTELGLDPHTKFHTEDGWKLVINAHRAIVKQFHPDRFAERPEAEQNEAMARTTEANRAYTTLQTARRSY